MIQGGSEVCEALKVHAFTSQNHFVFKGPCLCQVGLHVHSMYRLDCFGSVAKVFNVADRLCSEVVEVFPPSYVN